MLFRSMAVEFKESDFQTISEKEWPLDHTSTKGLYPYIKRLGDDIVGIEIGTSCAESTYLLLEKCPNIKKIYTIDPYLQFEDWIGTITQDILDRQLDIAKRNLDCFGDRVEMLRMTSKDALKMFKKESMDFIFVDGDHSYEGTKWDCHNYYPILKEGGFFCSHDYGFLEDVRRAVDDFRKEEKIKAPVNPTLNTAFYWYK